VSNTQKLFVVAGPTASGKSQLAIDLANKINGEIVNSDAIQVYKNINILSASPSQRDKESISHHLYNYIDLEEDYSVGRYIKDATSIIHAITEQGKVPILVGGTGMYIKSLCYGIHNIPDIDPMIRQKARMLFQEQGNEKFYHELQKFDPIGANELHPSNSQRLIRYYEVFLQTGRSITEFYKDRPTLFLEKYDIQIIILEPDRKMLYERCDKRFNSMLDNGAIEEVLHIRSLYNDTTAATKVIGFNEIGLYLDGTISKDDAISLAQTRTRQYAKRQMTWFRHQIEDAIRIDPNNNTIIRDLHI